MKATQRDFAQVASRPGAKFRLYFFCGPDEAGAAAAAAKLVAKLPDAGERVELLGQDLRSDPTKLVDEARSTSLFGDSRHLYARVAGEDAHDAIATFLELLDRGEADAAWPIFILASAATDKSRSAKLLIARDDALVGMFYVPKLEDLTADIRTMADTAGLRLSGDLAARIARASNLDVRLARSEVEKLALYLGASPQTPKMADAEAFDAVGAQTEEDGLMPLVDAVLGGELRRLSSELRRLHELSLNPVGVTLALERRAAQLAGLAAKRRPGDEPMGFVKAQGVFSRDQRQVAEQLSLWTRPKLERLVPRLAELHRALLANSAMAELLLAQELAQIARFARFAR